MKWRILVCFFFFIGFIESNDNIEEIQDSKTIELLQHYEFFFKEAFAQHYESFKIQKDSKSGLSYIDFCMYPPDRSLPSTPFENGRFRGERIRDLPFACDKSSGAKKYFLPHTTLQSSYQIMQNLSIAAFLPQIMPLHTIEITQQSTTIRGFWYHKHLWFFYNDSISTESRILIFMQKGEGVEIIVQYRNMSA